MVDVRVQSPLAIRDISKQFGAFSALTDVSLTFEAGEIHAICGENGAGKSTLVKILSGVFQPSQGSVLIDGRITVIDGPRRAQELGIAVVAQELSLCGELTILDNIWLGSMRVPMFHRRAALTARAREVLELLGLGGLDISRTAGSLRLGERQLVEIARALARDARTLILDEPTATLSDVEIERLFRALDALRAAGRSILYISHRLNEVFALCDTVTVLRNGRLISSGPASGLTRESLIERMLGRSLGDMFHPYAPLPTGTAVTVRNLTVPHRVERFDAVAPGGAILCIAGQVGSGATDVIDALAGLVHDADGHVLVGQQAVPLGSTAAALDHGLMLVSGDRAREGIFLDLSVQDNLAATSLDRFARVGFLDTAGLARFAVETGRLLGVDAGRMAGPARTLSGGNQQKLAFGRYVGRNGFGVLLMNEPTRGVDVGARAEIYKLMRSFCDRGWALILTSTDLEEILGLGDQVITMFRGRAVGRYQREDLTMGRLVADITHPDDAAAMRAELVS